MNVRLTALECTTTANSYNNIDVELEVDDISDLLTSIENDELIDFVVNENEAKDILESMDESKIVKWLEKNGYYVTLNDED